MVAGLQRTEFPDPITRDEDDELELSLALSIGGGKKRKAEIDFLSGSFPAVGSVKEEIRTPNPNLTPIPAMPMYMPPPCRSLQPPLVNPNPNPNLNLNENPNPRHGENGGERSVRMKRTPFYSGSPMSSSSGPIRGSSSCSETRSHSDPYPTNNKSNKQAIQEVVSNPTPAAAAAEKIDPMPCVMTLGRNGNAVNGVLYRYNEREVSIVCVCHGTSFSPEEFIRHAGGVESSNPFRQIVVAPSLSSFCSSSNIGWLV